MSGQPEYPRLLTYVWEGQDLALTFMTPDGQVHDVTFGRWYSSLPLRLQGTIWPHRRSEDFTLPDQEIVFMVESPQGIVPYTFWSDDSIGVYGHVCQDRPPNPQLLVILYDDDTFTVRYSVDGGEVQEVTVGMFPSRHPYRLLDISSDAHVKRRNYDPLLCLTVQTAGGYARGLSFQVDREELKEVYANLSSFMRSFDFPKAEAAILYPYMLQAA